MKLIKNNVIKFEPDESPQVVKLLREMADDIENGDLLCDKICIVTGYGDEDNNRIIKHIFLNFDILELITVLDLVRDRLKEDCF